MIEFEEFGIIMTALAALFPRFQLKRDTIDAYYAILGDLPADLLRAATLEIGSRDSPWFPAAGELRAAAFRLVERQNGVLTAGEAWAEVTQKIHEDGHWRGPEFSNPLIADAVKGVGGFRGLCFSENVVADRARFYQVYEILAKRRTATMAMLPAVRAVAAQLMAGGGGILEAGDDPPAP